MIRTNSDYAQAVEKVVEFEGRLDARRSELVAMGLKAEQIEKLLEPELVFYDQIKDEIASYDRLRRGDQTELARYSDFQEIGKLLIALRIFKGMSQHELAKSLEVDPSQVSRDERNEYHGITMQRILKILNVLGVKLESTPIIVPDFPSDRRELEYV